ncbi:ATP-binding protein [Krasilnikovia sp. MM14-A1004]|uniref:ATP-binding protein n=1 Tax=Krasilnikovia sp. MM14-A1004 TaxID=3373541 RepID=UPI00399CD697
MEERSGSCASQETLRPAAGRRSDAAPAASPTSPVLLDRTFGRDDITTVRHEVTDRLTAAGFAGDRLHGFVLAVNEVITNVVLHAGGHGRIVVWVTAGSAWCTVTDSGPGIPERLLGCPGVPEAFEVGGRGIWLAHQLCDEVTIATGPIGTTIGLRIALEPAHRP